MLSDANKPSSDGSYAPSTRAASDPEWHCDVVLRLLTCLILRLRYCGQELCGDWDPDPPVVIEPAIPGRVISSSCFQFVISGRHKREKVRTASARVRLARSDGVQATSWGERNGIASTPICGLRHQYIPASLDSK